jgi:hypothetical protein
MIAREAAERMNENDIERRTAGGRHVEQALRSGRRSSVPLMPGSRNSMATSQLRAVQ